MKNHSSLWLVCAASSLLAACTTNVPAPVIDRSAERTAPRVVTPSMPQPSPVQVMPQPVPSGVVTAPAPGAVIYERSVPPAGITQPPSTINGAQPGNTTGSAFHVVQRGETLYRIALNNGISVEALSAWNNLAAGQAIREGQVLRIRPLEGSITSVTPIATPAGDTRSLPAANGGAPLIVSTEPIRVSEPRAQRLPYSDAALAQAQRADAGTRVMPPATGASSPVQAAGASPSLPAGNSSTLPSSTSPSLANGAQALSGEPEIKPGNGVERNGVSWTWPTTGRVASKFSDRAPMKGIDIAAKSGTAVVAAAPGKVIYVGKEPRGYGQMIVVSHAKETVSVYFHTDKVLVKEQQRVTLGQRIAEVSDTSGGKMHFEVRQQSRPVDPIGLMPAR